MKVLQKSFLVVLIALFSTASASAHMTSDDPAVQKQELRKEILKLVQPDVMEEYKLGDAFITFMVTAQNEIIVLKVETENSFLEKYLKSRLNYTKVKTDGIAVNSRFKMNMSFQKNTD